MEYKNNAFDIILKIAKELYPDTKTEIYFSELLIKDDGTHPFGCTIFPDDGSIPIIEIGLHTPLGAVPEIIAHEIAHVVAGIEVEHNKQWEVEFNKMQKRWEEVMHEEYGMPLEEDK